MPIIIPGGVDPTAAIAAHEADTTNVHGVADTAVLQRVSTSKLIAPFFPGLANNAAIWNDGRLRVVRCVVPATGFLRDITFFSQVASGNFRVSVWDIGLQTNAVYTRLYESVSTAMVGTTVWHSVLDPGAAAVPVTAGQQIMLGLAINNAVAQVARVATQGAAINQLPASYLGAYGGMTNPLLCGRVDLGAGLNAAASSYADGGLVADNYFPLIIARVA